jgi:hypothetical protein
MVIEGQTKTRLLLVKMTCSNIIAELERKKLDIFYVVPHGYSDIVISGGFLPSIFNGEYYNVKDIDVFVLNCPPTYKIPLAEKLRGPIASHAPPRPPEILESIIVGTCDVGQYTYHINLITTTYKTRQDLIAHFDMEQCKMHYQDASLYFTKRILWLIENKKIPAKDAMTAKSSRLNRYTSIGWTIEK